MALLFRLLRATFLFGVILASYLLRYGLSWLLSHQERQRGRWVYIDPPWLEESWRNLHVTNARRLYRGMVQLRGVFIKLGQVLSLTGGFLPRAYTRELEALQDQVPPRPFEELEAAFVESLGKPPSAFFEKIEREPLAAASLGQVHVAYLPGGRKVAVKVLYPGIRDIIRVDMQVVGWALRVYKWFFPMNGIERVHTALLDLLRRETDYLHEAACMERMAKNFADEPDIVFPEPIREVTSRDVLTMTFMEGFKITRKDEMLCQGIDPSVVATRLVQSFYKQLFVDRFFHADPHPGNFLVQAHPAGPRIVVLDFGAISEAGDELIDGAFDVLQAIMTQDKDALLRGIERMGFVARDGNRALLEQTVTTYFQRLLKIQDRTPAALMKARREDLEQLIDPELERAELRELMRAFDYPEGWFYVERASVMMFWLVAQIDPTLDALPVGMGYVLPKVMLRQFERATQQASESKLPPEPEPIHEVRAISSPSLAG
ncbi:MAG: AarF/UbiB family protein [Myxococcales bacterium]|nr:AarF/UbiB family protein [Polyangiaceae bacterium]MDW8249636.1 AarF/UbiB family protein [Myxococcales bacterium]